MDSLLWIDPNHPQFTPLPLFRLELLARPSHLPFLAIDRQDGVRTKSWTLHPVPHLPLKPLPHLFAPRRIRVRGRARGIDEALVCMQHIRTDVLRERSRMPSDLRDRIPLRRIFKTRTEAHEHTTDTQLQHHRVNRRSTRSVPSLVDGADRGTCCGPQLSASDRRKPAGAQPRPVLALLCSAYSRTGSGVPVPVPAPQRTAQHLASLVGSGICGEVVGGRTM
ncbi:hypothetical protein EDB84DRAFT_278362 [Lactarius hengduanensis]|nr:hypothetical protein EDB84DRAFT_278362 [Lactarius hengduanensis]